jgi:hypothetical protein
MSADTDDRLRPALRRVDVWRKATADAQAQGRRARTLYSAAATELARARGELAKARARIAKEDAAS